ncbi:putative extracellular membrane protein, CFEM [Septoria linicola]|nr:putative extracellular membrane protein, CFEM [Septoria linicola]
MLVSSALAAITLLFTNVGASTLDTGLSKRRISTYPPLPTLSTCSLQCLVAALPASGCTGLTDTACLCASVPFAEAGATCLAANCTVVESLEARRFSAINCKEPIRDQGWLTRNVSWAMFALATFGTFARVFSRMRRFGGTGFGWDDYTILLGWLILIPSDAILDVMVTEGLGQDIWMLPDPNYQISEILKLFYVSEWTYIIELTVTKVSILLLYLRMWPETRPDSRWFRRSCLLLIGIMTLFVLLCMVVLGLGCQPLEFFWLRWDGIHQGYCINQNALIFSTAGLTIAFDVACIILPLPRLIALEIPTRKKIAVLVTFALGGFVTICSIIRLRTLVQWGNATNVTLYYNPIAIWSNVELNLGVLCACIPATAGLLQRLYSKFTGRKFTTYGQRSGLGTNKEKEQELDRDYELRVQSIDGSSRYVKQDVKGGPTTVGVHAMYNEMDARSSISRDDVIIVEERPLPPIRETEPRASTSPHEAVDQMIHNGYTQFAKIKR